MRRLFSALLVSAFVLGGIMFMSCESGSDNPIIIPQSHVQTQFINPNSAAKATDIELFADLSVSKAAEFSAVNVTVIPSDAKVKVSCDTDVVSLIESPDEVDDSYVVKFKPKKQGTFKVTAESGTQFDQFGTFGGYHHLHMSRAVLYSNRLHGFCGHIDDRFFFFADEL